MIVVISRKDSFHLAAFMLAANVLALGEEADFEALNFLQALNLIRSTNLLQLCVALASCVNAVPVVKHF
jgi:hypothetical protein